jgi:hypothetical protein
MTTRSSVFRISARMPGAVLASALCIAAPMVAVTSAPTQAQQVSVSAEFRTALEPHGRWERHSRWGMGLSPFSQTQTSGGVYSGVSVMLGSRLSLDRSAEWIEWRAWAVQSSLRADGALAIAEQVEL